MTETLGEIKTTNICAGKELRCDAPLPKRSHLLNYSSPSTLNLLNHLDLAIAQNAIAGLRGLVVFYPIYRIILDPKGVTLLPPCVLIRLKHTYKH